MLRWVANRVANRRHRWRPHYARGSWTRSHFSGQSGRGGPGKGRDRNHPRAVAHPAHGRREMAGRHHRRQARRTTGEDPHTRSQREPRRRWPLAALDPGQDARPAADVEDDEEMQFLGRVDCECRGRRRGSGGQARVRGDPLATRSSRGADARCARRVRLRTPAPSTRSG